MFTEFLSSAGHSSKTYGPETNKRDLELHGVCILVGETEKVLSNFKKLRHMFH